MNTLMLILLAALSFGSGMTFEVALSLKGQSSLGWRWVAVASAIYALLAVAVIVSVAVKGFK